MYIYMYINIYITATYNMQNKFELHKEYWFTEHTCEKISNFNTL